jgi:very-short-patch-repair endonuclease
MKRRKCYGDSHIKFRQAGRFRQEMTISEQILWSKLRGNRLMDLHFRRQHVIRGYIVDFYCHEAKWAVEVDGSVHEFQKESDQIRDSVLFANGLFVLYLSTTIVENNLEEAIRTIERKCRERISGDWAAA